MKLRFITQKGRAVCKYDGQCQYQRQRCTIYADGRIYFDYQEDIGSYTCSSDVFNGIAREISFPYARETMTQAKRKSFFKDNEKLFKILINGMGEKWNGNNYIGTLTEEAENALEVLQFLASEVY